MERKILKLLQNSKHHFNAFSETKTEDQFDYENIYQGIFEGIEINDECIKQFFKPLIDNIDSIRSINKRVFYFIDYQRFEYILQVYVNFYE